MFKFRTLILAATAATIAIGGVTAVSTAPAEAGWFKEKRQERALRRHERRGVMGWFGNRREARRGWSDRRERRHWKKRKHNRWDSAQASPRYARPLK